MKTITCWISVCKNYCTTPQVQSDCEEDEVLNYRLPWKEWKEKAGKIWILIFYWNKLYLSITKIYNLLKFNYNWEVIERINFVLASCHTRKNTASEFGSNHFSLFMNSSQNTPVFLTSSRKIRQNIVHRTKMNTLVGL